jgi:hypothetical protein
MVGLEGTELPTPHPAVEPVSAIRVRNGIFCCRDRTVKWADSPHCGSSRVLRGLFTAYRCRERVSFSAKRFRALFISGCVGGSDWLAKRS